MKKSTLKIGKRDKFLSNEIVFNLFDEYITDSFAGRRTKKNGQRIKHGTINNYLYLHRYLKEFEKETGFELKVYIESNLTFNEKFKASTYYRKFYNDFTSYLYDHKGFYDNYIGLLMRGLRSFFNYLEFERRISIGFCHKAFYIPKEDIQIIALSIEQLNFLIYDEQFKILVAQKNLEKIRDVFVFGCTVALRVSDLLELSKQNLVITNTAYYLKVKSQKTATHTSIKLPDYAIDIIKKYETVGLKLLPEISIQWFNEKLKVFAKLFPENFEIIKTKERRGKQVIIYKDPVNKIHYRLSDHITTHTMRRTAITTMLNLGMPEYIVRKISGHAANSKEFFKYVRLSQNIVDQETDKVFEKIRLLNQPGQL
jgi:integrase